MPVFCSIVYATAHGQTDHGQTMKIKVKKETWANSWLRIKLARIFSQHKFENLFSKVYQPGNKIWKTDGGVIHFWRLASWHNARLNIQGYFKVVMSTSLEDWAVFAESEARRWLIDEGVEKDLTASFLSSKLKISTFHFLSLFSF